MATTMMAAHSRPDLSNVRPREKPAFEEDLLDDDEVPMEEMDEPKRRQLDPLAADEAFVVEGVLSHSQCDDLASRVEALGLSFWNLEDPCTSFRNAFTVEVKSQKLADALWDRLQPLVPERLSLRPESPLWERGMEGEWQACGVHRDFLFAKYHPGGHFSPHTDGCTVIDFDHRSLYTALVYLCDCAQGGATRLLRAANPGKIDEDSHAYGTSEVNQVDIETHEQEFELDKKGRYRWPEECVVAEAKARKGDTLVFRQDMPHEGEPVGEGCTKFLIRTDIMYRRVNPVLVEEKDKRAYQIFKEAEMLELEGKAMEAARLFRQCVKLSPALACIYGM